MSQADQLRGLKNALVALKRRIATDLDFYKGQHWGCGDAIVTYLENLQAWFLRETEYLKLVD